MCRDALTYADRALENDQFGVLVETGSSLVEQTPEKRIVLLQVRKRCGFRKSITDRLAQRLAGNVPLGRDYERRAGQNFLDVRQNHFRAPLNNLRGKTNWKIAKSQIPYLNI